MTSLDFADAARVLGREARHNGLVVPSFRSPPLRVGDDRSLRRAPNGHVFIAVTLKGRAKADVLADMVDGVIEANYMANQPVLRQRLWEAVSC